MKIIFFNVWHGKIREGIADFLREHVADTDVFCLQEADESTRVWCREILSSFQERHVYKHESPHAYYDQTIYVREGIDILSAESLLETQNGRGLALIVSLSYEGKGISVCNVHGVPHPGEKRDTPERLEQSRVILDALAQKEGYKVVGGDFNLMPEIESITMFSKNGYKDLIQEYKIENTRNRLNWEKHERKQYYSDYVFVSQELKVEEFSVPYNEISDHLPLILKFHFPQAE